MPLTDLSDATPQDNLPGTSTPAPEPQIPRGQSLWWQGKYMPAFWTIASVLSLLINLILFVTLIILGQHLFDLKRLVGGQLVGGLHSSFVQMDQAHIRTTISVKDTIQVVDKIPVVFDLPLNQDTEVRLVQDTPLKNTTIFLNGSAVKLNLILPKGTRLGISLNLTVPVSQTIPVRLNVPVNLQVPVDIPLDQTELHQPFVGLQDVVGPYNQMLAGLPDRWTEAPFCQAWRRGFCALIFGKP
jgi:hypothetical protein